MAHFAKIDQFGYVAQVIVVDNKDTSDAGGTEKESIGAAFCERLFGGTWKQTSYNGSFRKHYAGIGYTYNSVRDAFIPPQPYQSWTLDDDANWKPPVAMPTDGQRYAWDEATQAWVAAAV